MNLQELVDRLLLRADLAKDAAHRSHQPEWHQGQAAAFAMAALMVQELQNDVTR